jgi:hypothetical protein
MTLNNSCYSIYIVLGVYLINVFSCVIIFACVLLGGDADAYLLDLPKVDVTDIVIVPAEKVPIGDPLSLTINFTLDKDAVAAYWVFKLLVDSCDKRIIKILGESRVDDYPDGESDVTFSVDEIDVNAIPPSTLANSGLLMACLMVDGAEVTSVNMVVNVTEERGRLYREIYNPLA